MDFCSLKEKENLTNCYILNTCAIGTCMTAEIRFNNKQGMLEVDN